MFSPNLGRWMTMDPIAYEAGDVNLYRYVGNDPVSGLDPSGLAGPAPDFNWSENARGHGQFSWGKLPIPEIPAIQNDERVFTHIRMNWQTFRCCDAVIGGIGNALPASKGGYEAWVEGTDVVKYLREKTIYIQLTPFHAGNNFTNNKNADEPQDPEMPSPYPKFNSKKEYSNYIRSSTNAKGYKGKVDILIDIRKYATNDVVGFKKPVTAEPTGPVENPSDIVHPRSPDSNTPIPVQPNRMQGPNPKGFRTMGLWSLDQPKFWSGKPSWQYTAKLTLEWDYCGDKLTYSKS